MQEQEALTSIYNNCLDENSIFLQLRNGDGITVVQYEELVKSVELLIKIYKDKEFVPKKLALSFLDITIHLYASEDLYSKNEFKDLEDMILHLEYLGEVLFS